MWNIVYIIIGYFGMYIVGAAIRYATRKWNRPLLVTICLIFVVFAITITKGNFLQTFKIRVIILACMILGALTADLIYRIRGKQTRN